MVVFIINKERKKLVVFDKEKNNVHTLTMQLKNQGLTMRRTAILD
jgi:hypothetical protein